MKTKLTKKPETRKNKIVIFTQNDIWRFIGIFFLISGYFFDKDISIQWGDKNFTGGIFGVVGLILIVAPIFLRNNKNHK